NADTLTQQHTRVLAKIEDQTFQVAHFIECRSNFMLSCLIEARDMHVADARSDHEMQVYAVASNLITHDSEFNRLLSAFTENRDVDRGSFGPFKQVGDIASGHVVGRLTINRDDDVTWMNARAVGRGSHERRDNNDLVIARPNGH